TAWYPSAVSVSADGKYLYAGSSKGLGGYSNIRGPHSPLPGKQGDDGQGRVKSLQRGSISVIPLSNLKNDIKGWTKQALTNCPYNDELLGRAKESTSGQTIIPSQVGAGSPIKH